MNALKARLEARFKAAGMQIQVRTWQDMSVFLPAGKDNVRHDFYFDPVCVVTIIVLSIANSVTMSVVERTRKSAHYAPLAYDGMVWSRFSCARLLFWFFWVYCWGGADGFCARWCKRVGDYLCPTSQYRDSAFVYRGGLATQCRWLPFPLPCLHCLPHSCPPIRLLIVQLSNH
jgi:hypothetical protein